MSADFDSFNKSAFDFASTGGGLPSSARDAKPDKIIGGSGHLIQDGLSTQGPWIIGSGYANAWTYPLAASESLNVKSIARVSASVIIAGTANANSRVQESWTSSGGLLRSANNGQSWTRSNHGTNNIVVASDGLICISADDSGGGASHANTVQTKIRRSIDGGATWADVFSIPSYLTVSGVPRYYCAKAAVCGANGEYLVAVYAPNESGFQSRIIRSVDYGATWAMTASTSLSRFIPFSLCSVESGIYIVGSIVGGLSVTGCNLWRSTDGGVSWAVRSPQFTTANRSIVKIIYLGGGIVLAGVNRVDGNVSSATGPAIFRSTDYGATWALWKSWAASDAANQFLTSMVLMNDGSVVAAVSGNLWRYSGGTWTLIGTVTRNTGSGPFNIYFWDMITG